MRSTTVGARRAIMGTSIVVAVALLTAAPTTLAAGGIKVCVPKKEGSVILTPKHGKCKRGYKLTRLGSEGKEGKPGAEGKGGPEGKAGSTGFSSGELETLKAILPFIKFIATGIAGKPTIQFSGVNVQVVSGAGKTNAAVNGEGNLVIGYDENASKREQTGSHDLIVGQEQEFTSFGGIVGGRFNAVTGEFASVTAGEHNAASAVGASVSGGFSNTASGLFASVSGGMSGTASGSQTSVSGGFSNVASENTSSVSGGYVNTASGVVSSVSGGGENKAEATFSWIGGGKGNFVFPGATLASVVSESFGDAIKETACVGAPVLFLEGGKC